MAAFAVLRASRVYGDPRPWNGTDLGFLNATKYPASLQFRLMTLGPAIALLPLAERAHGRIAGALAVFGRVPLFANHPMMNPPPPAGYTWGLPLLYVVFVTVVAMLYVPCRWFAGVKARRRENWLRYL